MRTDARIAIAFCLAAAGCANEAPTPTHPETTAVPVSRIEPIATAAPPPRDDGRLPEGAVPLGYRLELRVDPSQPSFTGRATIDLEVGAPTHALVLHGRGLTVRSVFVEAAGRRQPGQAEPRLAARSKGEPEELVIKLKEPVGGGAARLVIDYEAPFQAGLRGLYRDQAGGSWYAFNQFEPTDARSAFPCFDEPAFKVPFELVITAPPGALAVSNMPEVSRTPVGQPASSAAPANEPTGGWTTFAFERSPPMPTYLVALAVGPLEVSPASSRRVPLRIVTTKGRSTLGGYAARLNDAQLDFLERYFGSPYPYSKIDLVAVPNFAAGAMENPGFITFREERLLIDETQASVGARRALAGTLAHELAHMWFGNLVTPMWWDDIWLNEGFATWMGTKVLDATQPNLRAGIDALGATAHAMRADTLSTARTVRQPVRSTTEALEAFDGITYLKGRALISMVERWLGEDAFQRGVRDYLERHRWGVARSADLFAALGRAGNKDVTGVMDSFTAQTGVPMVSVRLACDGAPRAVIEQTEYRPLGAAAAGSKRWKVPVCVRFSAGRSARRAATANETDDKADERCILVDNPSAEVALGSGTCPAWIHPNAEQAGYYHARLEQADLAKLVATLPALSARERAGILMDTWANVRGGSPASDFLDLLASFNADPESVVWDAALDPIDFLYRDVLDGKDREALSRFVRHFLSAPARKLGWSPKKGEDESTELKRRRIVASLGFLGRDPATIATARKLTLEWLADATKVDGNRASIAVPLAADTGDPALYERFLAASERASTPENKVLALLALGSFDQPELVRRTLSLIADGRIKAQDQRYVFIPLFDDPKSRATAFETAAASIDALFARIPPKGVPSFVDRVARTCDRTQAARAHALLAPHIARVEGGDRALAQAIERAERCAAFREAHAASLTKWLSGHR